MATDKEQQEAEVAIPPTDDAAKKLSFWRRAGQASQRRIQTKPMRAPHNTTRMLMLGGWALSGCTCPTTTVSGLLSKEPISKPETVCVRAVYRGSVECEPCPATALCQPCRPAVLLAESADTPPEGLVWVFGTTKGLVKGRTYTFELELRPGFLEQLRAQDNNPVYFRGPPPAKVRAVRE